MDDNRNPLLLPHVNVSLFYFYFIFIQFKFILFHYLILNNCFFHYLQGDTEEMCDDEQLVKPNFLPIKSLITKKDTKTH